MLWAEGNAVNAGWQIAPLNQSCGGVALRRAEAGGGLSGYERQAKGPRSATLRIFRAEATAHWQSAVAAA